MATSQTGLLKVLNPDRVRLIQSCGTDLTVVNAARVSFAKESKEFSDSDSKLIRYLAKNNHWTPFGHCTATFAIQMPIFVARQWMRSNVGIVYNEVSRRYVDDDIEIFVPDEWRSRPTGSIKQGSGPPLKDQGKPFALYSTVLKTCTAAYYELLQMGVAPEQARIVLPVSLYTEVWMTASLAALARVCGLRDESHAQVEIQEYAKAVSKICSSLWPVSWAALTTKEAN